MCERERERERERSNLFLCEKTMHIMKKKAMKRKEKLKQKKIQIPGKCQKLMGQLV